MSCMIFWPLTQRKTLPLPEALVCVNSLLLTIGLSWKYFMSHCGSSSAHPPGGGPMTSADRSPCNAGRLPSSRARGWSHCTAVIQKRSVTCFVFNVMTQLELEWRARSNYIMYGNGIRRHATGLCQRLPPCCLNCCCSERGTYSTQTTMNLDNDQSSASPLLEGENSVRPTRSEQVPQAIGDGSSNHRIRRTVSLMLSPLIDESGSGWGVLLGICTLIIVGSSIGICLPKNEALPTPWYRYVSASIGYIYFLCWSVSFYPQVISNFKRRSTRGLSPEFCGLNVIGFACYAIYNLSFYWSAAIQDLYKHRHGQDSEITVQSNDVAFAVHAFVLASVTLFQIAYYDGIRALRPSKYIGYMMCSILTVCVFCAALVILSVGNLNWLDYLYMLSFVKILITLIKYIPQVILNFRRKSTVGWSIWNILLDFTGGTLSDLQLVLDCADLGDFTGITGNLAKFGLGFVSITFDLIFMLQHYVLFPKRGETRPLIYEDNKSDDEVA